MEAVTGATEAKTPPLLLSFFLSPFSWDSEPYYCIRLYRISESKGIYVETLSGKLRRPKMGEQKIDEEALAIVEIVKSMSDSDLGEILRNSVRWQLLEYPTMSYKELKENMIDEIIMSIEQSDNGSEYYLSKTA
tara:strand:- start:6858 stop:7259 length:402 start_codon:yes stop_codon:yes gene_type:complete